jgi:hypothetical protein
MRRLAISPGDMSSCAAILLIVGPRLVGVEVEDAIILFITPGLTGASASVRDSPEGPLNNWGNTA